MFLGEKMKFSKLAELPTEALFLLRISVRKDFFAYNKIAPPPPPPPPPPE